MVDFNILHTYEKQPHAANQPFAEFIWKLSTINNLLQDAAKVGSKTYAFTAPDSRQVTEVSVHPKRVPSNTRCNVVNCKLFLLLIVKLDFFHVRWFSFSRCILTRLNGRIVLKRFPRLLSSFRPCFNTTTVTRSNCGYKDGCWIEKVYNVFDFWKQS